MFAFTHLLKFKLSTPLWFNENAHICTGDGNWFTLSEAVHMKPHKTCAKYADVVSTFINLDSYERVRSFCSKYARQVISRNVL